MADYDEGFFSIDQLLLEEANVAEIESENQPSREQVKGKPDVTLQEKKHIVNELLLHMTEDKVTHGFQTKLARAMGVHKSTICKIHKDLKKQKQLGAVIDVSSKKKGTVGRKHRTYEDVLLQSVPLHKRTTIRSFAGALNLPHSTVHRLLKQGKLRSHTSSNHPSLSEKHKIERMKWVLRHIEPGTPQQQATFGDMQNVIHIDEKWFYLNPDMRRFYLLPNEDDPYRCCQSKRFKIKVMFMGVVSRPLYDVEGNMIHDGKYGIYPFVFKETAKKSSKNRPKGTIETKAVQNVTQEVIRSMIINKVIPDIMAKWPAQLSKEIYIQQDNARPHIKPTDQQFQAAAKQNGFDIKLVFQPPQSPDLNVLDLGLFRSFQSIQYQSFPKNLDELILKVEEAYENYDPTLMKYTWLQLQYVMVEILKEKGGNNYKNPHHGKQSLDRRGMLPHNVKFDQAIVDEAVAYLNEMDNQNVSIHEEEEGVIDAD